MLNNQNLSQTHIQGVGSHCLFSSFFPFLIFLYLVCFSHWELSMDFRFSFLERLQLLQLCRFKMSLQGYCQFCRKDPCMMLFLVLHFHVFLVLKNCSLFFSCWLEYLSYFSGDFFCCTSF